MYAIRGKAETTTTHTIPAHCSAVSRRDLEHFWHKELCLALQWWAGDCDLQVLSLEERELSAVSPGTSLPQTPSPKLTELQE